MCPFLNVLRKIDLFQKCRGTVNGVVANTQFIIFTDKFMFYLYYYLYFYKMKFADLYRKWWSFETFCCMSIKRIYIDMWRLHFFYKKGVLVFIENAILNIENAENSTKPRLDTAPFSPLENTKLIMLETPWMWSPPLKMTRKH